MEGKTLIALVGATVTIDKGPAKIVYSVQYDVIYKLPISNIPKEVTQEMFDAFSKHNGLLNGWPYIRALITNLSSEVGFPVVLPLLKIQAKTDGVEKESQ
ncbi:hypothetical protein [Bdellovibrio bacteriovorus]|uniref:Uncharacterized protein n=1 Tax=Bdellovibrio bacteriovorus TaxID=959 RepID=A0A1Z3N9W7_BDEBC|nr:hypothetical protein [Bdellovibrio bacteriovorus]ASD64246.1 hypothetical protein B9G79_12045 [Bdellovibrio bacteriovorus]